MKNIIQTQLSTEDREAIDTKLQELETLLQGKLSALTSEQRIEYGAINEQNKLLVNKVRDYYQNAPKMVAPELDWQEFEKD